MQAEGLADSLGSCQLLVYNEKMERVAINNTV